MEQDVTSEPSFMDTTMPIRTTPTNINAIILNSQIPGAQRLQGSAADTMSVTETVVSQPNTTITGGHLVSGLGQTIVSGQKLSGQIVVSGPSMSSGHTIVSASGQQVVSGQATSEQMPVVSGQMLSRQMIVTGQAVSGKTIVSGQTVPGHAIVSGQAVSGQTVSGHAIVSGQSVTGHSVASVSGSQAQLPIIASAGSLKLPPFVAVDGAIKPDISLCSRVLKSFSDQDQASSDLEVQSVMFPETRGLLPTVKRICPSRSSSSSKSSKSSYSPMRQPTTLTNAKRGNVQTVTPTFLPEDMTIHQLAAQGELTLLSERVETYFEKVDKPDVQGYTPLMWACAHDQMDIIEYLLRHGADVSKVSIEGECALSFACSNGNFDVVKLLLAENVDINNYDWNGGTPLLYAAYNDHPKCCALLLEAGADMTIETDSGHTALSLASALGYHAVQQVIEKHMLGLLQKF